MAEDGEVLRQIWDSYLPISFQLSTNDLHSIKNPEPYYLMVPRLSYFSLITDKIVVYFSKFIDSKSRSASDLWLDFYGIPLKFNYPIGLLYDIYSNEIDLPWNITVNFDNFPANKLVRCNTRPTMESTFMYSLKEADAIKHKTVLVNCMQKKDHIQLWTGLVNYKFEQFWSINRRLMVPDEDKSHFKAIPFRLYLVVKSKDQASGGDTGQTNTDTPLFVQKLIKPVLEDGELARFSHLIEQTLRPSETAMGEDNHQYILHGIHVPLDTPLQWMSEHLSYLDNFLHIIVKSKT